MNTLYQLIGVTKPRDTLEHTLQNWLFAMCVGLTYPADLVEHFLTNTEVTLTPDLETCCVVIPVPGFNLLRNIYTEDCSRSYMLIKQVIR